MPRLWAQTSTFESVSVGDELPIVVKWETEESISRYRSLAASSADADPGTRGPAEEDPQDEATLPLSTLRGYVTELLQKGFPPESLTTPESRLELTAQLPVVAGDTISLTGRVVSKGSDEARLVECRVLIEKEDGQTVGEATAVVRL